MSTFRDYLNDMENKYRESCYYTKTCKTPDDGKKKEPDDIYSYFNITKQEGIGFLGILGILFLLVVFLIFASSGSSRKKIQ